jgi:hypothetical protein
MAFRRQVVGQRDPLDFLVIDDQNSHGDIVNCRRLHGEWARKPDDFPKKSWTPPRFGQ